MEDNFFSLWWSLLLEIVEFPIPGDETLKKSFHVATFSPRNYIHPPLQAHMEGSKSVNAN